MIRLNNLCKIYGDGSNSVPALKNVSMHVAPGEFLAIMGPSGSGKSTLMNILGCLDTPTSGEYFLNGHEMARLDRRELTRVRGEQIGFVFQSFMLLSKLSALENVEIPMMYQGVGPRERRRRAERMLKMMGLSKRMGHLPSELSGGQCQRVAIARALVNNPKIILADEPTGNLDTRTGDEIMGILREFHQRGVTIVLITHEPEIAAYADRTATLRDGWLEEGGAH